MSDKSRVISAMAIVIATFIGMAATLYITTDVRPHGNRFALLTPKQMQHQLLKPDLDYTNECGE